MLERNYTQDSNKNILEISTSSDAYRMIKEFEKSNEQMFNTSASTYLESFTRKLHGSAARIAGLLHIWRHDEPEKYHVSLQDMESGVIIAKTILSHADYAFNPSGLCAFNDAIKIIEWQRRHRHYRFNSRDVGQGIRIDGNDRIYLALDLLERCHIITQAKVPGHPHLCAVHPTFA
jgi:hypothetical protein